ncbi:MAG: hypothetical protein ACXWQO_14655 [Bdellovibrionota bacterium]
MKILIRAFQALLVVFLVLITWLVVDIYWPHQITGLQLSANTTVIGNNINSRHDAVIEIKGPDAAAAIKLMNEWLAANQFGWHHPWDDTIPQAEFRDGDLKVQVWNNLIIVDSPRLGWLIKEIDAQKQPGLSEILKVLHQD